MEKRNCIDCGAFDPTGEEIGLCKRNAPSPGPLEYGSACCVWPVVSAGEWCFNSVAIPPEEEPNE